LLTLYSPFITVLTARFTCKIAHFAHRLRSCVRRSSYNKPKSLCLCTSLADCGVMETNYVLYQVRAEYFCTCNVFILVDGSLCHGSDGYSPASRPGDPGSISYQSICVIHTGHSGTGKAQRFSPLTVIPPLLHGHFHRRVALAMQIQARSLGPSKPAMLCHVSGALGRECVNSSVNKAELVTIKKKTGNK